MLSLFSLLSAHERNGILSKTIHVYGDSHAYSSFTVAEPKQTYTLDVQRVVGQKRVCAHVIIHYIGPVTMHRIGRDGIRDLTGIKEGDVVVFVFGEIDVRCHIGKQRDRGKRELDEVITSLVQNYTEAIFNFKKQHLNLMCIVFMIVPPTDSAYNPQYPFYGMLEDRVNITKKMNQVLRRHCVKYGFEFLDVYDTYADSQGALLLECAENVHIHPKYNEPVKDKLMSILFGIL